MSEGGNYVNKIIIMKHFFFTELYICNIKFINFLHYEKNHFTISIFSFNFCLQI